MAKIQLLKWSNLNCNIDAMHVKWITWYHARIGPYYGLHIWQCEKRTGLRDSWLVNLHNVHGVNQSFVREVETDYPNWQPDSASKTAGPLSFTIHVYIMYGFRRKIPPAVANLLKAIVTVKPDFVPPWNIVFENC